MPVFDINRLSLKSALPPHAARRGGCYELKGGNMGKKEEYIEKLTTQLKTWESRMDDFALKAEHEAMEQKNRLQREITEFKIKRLEAQVKLRQLKAASGDAWEALAAGMDKAWGEMKEAVHQVSEKFKQPR